MHCASVYHVTAQRPCCVPLRPLGASLQPWRLCYPLLFGLCVVLWRLVARLSCRRACGDWVTRLPRSCSCFRPRSVTLPAAHAALFAPRRRQPCNELPAHCKATGPRGVCALRDRLHAPGMQCHALLVAVHTQAPCLHCRSTSYLIYLGCRTRHEVLQYS